MLKNDLVKKCIDIKWKVVRPRYRPKQTWSKVIENDSQTQQLCKEDAMDCRKWRKLIKVLYNSHKDKV